MAITAGWYGTPIQNWMTGANTIDFDTDTIKCMLTTVTYVPNNDTHAFKSDVTNEVSATGYTAGGFSLTGKAVSIDSTTNEVRWDSNDPSWTITGTMTSRIAVYYKDTGTAATSPLISFVNFGADESITDGTFTIVQAATGIAKFVY